MLAGDPLIFMPERLSDDGHRNAGPSEAGSITAPQIVERRLVDLRPIERVIHPAKLIGLLPLRSVGAGEQQVPGLLPSDRGLEHLCTSVIQIGRASDRVLGFYQIDSTRLAVVIFHLGVPQFAISGAGQQ